MHQNVGADQRNYVCTRKMWGEKCAVCELIEKMRAANPQDERIKELWPFHRYLFFVYDTRSQETEKKGLQWFDAPPSVKDGIVNISKDKRTGKARDVSSRITGADISFDKIGSGKNSTKYVAFQLTEGPQPPESWYSTAPDDFEEFLLHPQYADVYAQVAQLGVAGPSPEASTAPAQSESRVRGEAPTGVVQDPTPTPTVAAPAQQPAPTAAVPAQQPPVVSSVETRTRGEAPQQVEVRVRGEASLAGGPGVVDDNVRARIDQLRQQG